MPQPPLLFREGNVLACNSFTPSRYQSNPPTDIPTFDMEVGVHPSIRARTLYQFLQDLRCGLSDVDVAHRVCSHAFHTGIIVLVGIRLRKRDECRDLSVLRASDSKTPFEAWIEHGIGLGIDDIDRVILVDGYSAGPAELFPLIEAFAILVEALDS